MSSFDCVNFSFIKTIPHNSWENIYTHSELPQEVRFTDTRTVLERIKDLALAKIRDVAIILARLPYRMATLFNYLPYPEYYDLQRAHNNHIWKETSSGLHVAIHGFRGHPSIWNKTIDELKRKDSQLDIRAPFVPQRGNCSLEIASAPISDMIRDYLYKEIEKKENSIIHISLSAVSNGTRIALNSLHDILNDELQNALASKNIRLAVKVDAIAGVLRGTDIPQIRVAHNSSLAWWIAKKIFRVSESILNDFKHKSESSKRLIEKVRATTDRANISITYNFYSSTEDNLIKPVCSSLPVLGKGERHYIVHGEGHTSIVNRVLPELLRTHEEWKH